MNPWTSWNNACRWPGLKWKRSTISQCLAQGVVVGHVMERESHPNADKLSVCKVDVGADEPLQIVCGAKNVRAGIHVPVATVGAVLPAVNLTIKAGELRGVASKGMICSLSELGLSSESMASPSSRNCPMNCQHLVRPWLRCSALMTRSWSWQSPPTVRMVCRWLASPGKWRP